MSWAWAAGEGEPLGVRADGGGGCERLFVLHSTPRSWRRQLTVRRDICNRKGTNATSRDGSCNAYREKCCQRQASQSHVSWERSHQQTLGKEMLEAAFQTRKRKPEENLGLETRTEAAEQSCRVLAFSHFLRAFLMFSDY